MKKLLALFIFLATVTITFCQKIDTSYTPLTYDFENGQGETKERRNIYYGSDAGAIFSGIMGAYNDKTKYEREREQNIAKLNILQRTWQEAVSKPDTITNGWHNAVATDNMNYYKVVKALVERNKVKRVVVENYIPLSFLPANEIRKAKTTLTLENLNNEALEVIELYFLYDLDQPVIVSEPIHAGYVCFWSDYGKEYKDLTLKIEGNKYKTPIKGRLIGEHDCFSEKMFCLVMKPGDYPIEIYYSGRPGPPDFRNVVIKPDMCLHYRIGPKKRATK